MLVGPSDLTLHELLTHCWWRWRICDLGDKICCRGFSDPVNEDTKQWYPKENVKSDAKPEQQSFSVAEPQAPLRTREPNPREVRLKLI